MTIEREGEAPAEPGCRSANRINGGSAGASPSHQTPSGQNPSQQSDRHSSRSEELPLRDQKSCPAESVPLMECS